MRLKKVNVKRQLKKTSKIKRIFIPELNTTEKSSFNLVLPDKTGEFNLNIQVRDPLGRIKGIKTVTFIPGKSVNLLGMFTQSDLLKSKELQEAIDKNILKYSENDVDILKPKPLLPYKTRISTPYEERTRTEQETFGGSDGLEITTQPLSNLEFQPLSNLELNINSKSIKKIQTYFNFKIYPHGSTPAENPDDLYYTYSILDEYGEALLKIPMESMQLLSNRDSIKYSLSNSPLESLYSFRNPSERTGDGLKYLGPSLQTKSATDTRPWTVEAFIYVLKTDYHRGIRSGVEEIFPVNDLGRTQKFGLSVFSAGTLIQYTVTTTPMSPLVKSTGVGDE